MKTTQLFLALLTLLAPALGSAELAKSSRQKGNRNQHLNTDKFCLPFDLRPDSYYENLHSHLGPAIKQFYKNNPQFKKKVSEVGLKEPFDAITRSASNTFSFKTAANWASKFTFEYLTEKTKKHCGDRNPKTIKFTKVENNPCFLYMGLITYKLKARRSPLNYSQATESNSFRYPESCRSSSYCQPEESITQEFYTERSKFYLPAILKFYKKSKRFQLKIKEIGQENSFQNLIENNSKELNLKTAHQWGANFTFEHLNKNVKKFCGNKDPRYIKLVKVRSNPCYIFLGLLHYKLQSQVKSDVLDPVSNKYVYRETQKQAKEPKGSTPTLACPPTAFSIYQPFWLTPFRG